MALFKVEGWNIDSKEIRFDAARKDGKVKKSRKERKEYQQKLAEQRRNRGASEVAEKNKEEEKADFEVEDDGETETPAEEKKPVEKKQKKRKAEEVESTSQAVTTTKKPLTALQQKMLAKLTGSRFRWINEQLYTISSDEALKLIKEQPQLFDEYHDGFRSQVQSWPENPVDVFVEQIRFRANKPVNAPGGLPGLKDKTIVVADMGCGEAQLALDINNFFKDYNKKAKKFNKRSCKVHSFDLKKANERVTVADIKNVPLADESCTIVVFCLALMGTNFLDFVNEAYRILAPRGELWIAEIKSRFADGKGEEFVNALKLQGFFHKNTDDSNKMFTRFEFFKPPQDIIEERKAKLERRQKFIEVETEKEELQKKRQKVLEGKWLLKPCIYKRR
ncbi:25S rRNA (adenine645-N1)-methyltransferase [Kluyveromyces marxianus]|nr:25S rRNA (adenine645-N1)-methyltransferase [Kluyveromyces marxianus]